MHLAPRHLVLVGRACIGKRNRPGQIADAAVAATAEKTAEPPDSQAEHQAGVLAIALALSAATGQEGGGLGAFEAIHVALGGHAGMRLEDASELVSTQISLLTGN